MTDGIGRMERFPALLTRKSQDKGPSGNPRITKSSRRTRTSRGSKSREQEILGDQRKSCTERSRLVTKESPIEPRRKELATMGQPTGGVAQALNHDEDSKKGNRSFMQKD